MSEREQFLRLIDSLLDTYRPEGVLIWLRVNHHRVVAGEWRALLGEAERLAGGPAS